jgi:hypothetical protein
MPPQVLRTLGIRNKASPQVACELQLNTVSEENMVPEVCVWRQFLVGEKLEQGAACPGRLIF